MVNNAAWRNSHGGGATCIFPQYYGYLMALAYALGKKGLYQGTMC